MCTKVVKAKIYDFICIYRELYIKIGNYEIYQAGVCIFHPYDDMRMF